MSQFEDSTGIPTCWICPQCKAQVAKSPKFCVLQYSIMRGEWGKELERAKDLVERSAVLKETTCDQCGSVFPSADILIGRLDGAPTTDDVLGPMVGCLGIFAILAAIYGGCYVFERLASR